MNNLYLIYGTDKALINKEIDKIINNLKIDENNIIKFNNDFTILNLIEEASTISLFSNKKILIIEGLNIFTSEEKLENIELLEDLLTKINDDVNFIFYLNLEKVDTRRKIYKIILNKGKIIEIKKDYNNLFNYVNNYLEGYKISNNDLNYFLSIVGTNIDNITNELDKLMTYKIKEKEIKKEDIELLVSVINEEEVFALTDSVIKGDAKKSLELYHKFIDQNYEISHLIALLASQFRLLYQVKRFKKYNLSNDEMAKILDAHPYRVKLALQNSYNHSLVELENYLIKLANLDKNIKLGNVNKSYLELFLINKDM